MRHVLMFVAGFAVVAVTGVAMAQTGLLAGESTEPDEWPAYATQTVDLPVADKMVGKSQPDSLTKTEITGKTESNTETKPATKTGAETKPEPGIEPADKSEPVEVSKLGEPLVWSITQKVKANETPYEKFYGTGSPGMKITATSPHGSASTTIDKSGNWVLGISFKSTAGSSFAVTVTTSTGWINNYSFSHLAAKTTTTTTKTTTPTKTDWTIAQKYAENTEPWTKFYGTGPEGTTVRATSDHGSAEVIVGKQGDWYLQVHFDVPAGTVIGVRVTNSHGFDQTYHFVWKSYELAVQQKFGSSTDSHEVFWGTAAPNSWVKVISAYGWTKVPTSKTGSFEATLHFENPPFDVAFEVEVYDATGNRKTFMFTRLDASA